MFKVISDKMAIGMIGEIQLLLQLIYKENDLCIDVYH